MRKLSQLTVCTKTYSRLDLAPRHWFADACTTTKAQSGPREDLVELGGAEVFVCGRCSVLRPFLMIKEKSLWEEQLEPGSPCIFLFIFWCLCSAGLVNPEGLFVPPLLPAAPSRRPVPLRCPHPKCAKRPLLGEKPGLLAPPPGE